MRIVKNSIGLRLLRMVFGLYFALTLAITIIQLVSEYAHVKQGVFSDMVDLAETLEDSLTRSLWSYNLEQMNATMVGIDRVSMISGAKVTQADESIYASTGTYPTKETVVSEHPVPSDSGEIKQIIYESESGLKTVYAYSFSIVQTENNRRILAGRGYLYTDRSSIINRVKYGFILIVISSVIKTLALWFIFLFFTKRIIAKPLAILTSATENLNPNNPSASKTGDAIQDIIDSGSNDEISSLSKVFVKMRDAVWEKIDVIEEQNRTLEERVKERTVKIEEINVQLKHMSMHDALTGLPNRMLFEQKLNDLVESCRRSEGVFALASIDLRKFKDVNDTYGHHAGDFVLKEVASRIGGVLSSNDTFARMGGDEYTILLPDVDRNMVDVIADKIIGCCDFPMVYENININVGINMGVSLYPEHERESDPLHKSADMAMYLAKNNELGFSLYSPEVGRSFRRAAALERDLVEALEKDELELCYQPVVTTEGNDVVSLEALMRWNHSKFGLLLPDEFIPIAERSNNIKRLTMWLLKTAFIHLKGIQKSGHAIKISVNLSSKMLSDNGFPRMISNVARRENVAAQDVQLEIMESSVLENPERTLSMLKQLKEEGFHITVSGFGTGYSSFNYLTNVYVDLLKIDRDLLLKFSPSSALIVRTIIELAHTLEIEVVAEGVENDALIALMKELKADYMQGFHFSVPLNAEGIVSWLGENKKLAQGG